METQPVIERVLGYAIRILPPPIPLGDLGLSWISVSIDTDFWPAMIDPIQSRGAVCPFPELWPDLSEALSNYDSLTGQVLVAITLPYFQGCEEENGYRDFVRMTEGFGPTGEEDSSWIDARPVLTSADEKWIRMGYDISYAGAFKSMLLAQDADSRWGMDISGKRTQFGLFESFWEAHAYSASECKKGLRAGWPIEETRLWPLALWLINDEKLRLTT